jgi:hypothetical protein
MGRAGGRCRSRRSACRARRRRSPQPAGRRSGPGKAHAAPGESLELVRARSAESRGIADLTDRHYLAAAGDDLVLGWDHDRARRTIEAIEKQPRCSLAVECGPDRRGAAIALGFTDAAEPHRGIESGERSRQHRSLEARDTSAITRDGNVGETRLPPGGRQQSCPSSHWCHSCNARLTWIFGMMPSCSKR